MLYAYRKNTTFDHILNLTYYEFIHNNLFIERRYFEK